MTQRKQYMLPELGYAYDALEPGYSADLLELHHSKHHQGYVDGANSTRDDLQAAREDSDFDKLNQLQKNLAFNLSGHVLHSLFWRNLAPNDGEPPAGGLVRHIDATFGDLAALKDQFSAAGAAIQGSGWVALSWDSLSQSLLVEQIYDHQGNVANGSAPILVMDMWEHAFYLQYRNEKKRWIKAFLKMINWQDVGARFDRVQHLDLGL